jgi:SAM-dependent methyltransferase
MRAVRIDPDAYGELLLAAYEGRDADEVMEREDGLIYVGNPSDYFAPFRRWPAAERKAMRFVRGRVLDVGAGAGRVALHLQERGHEVVAIDTSPLALEVCRRRGVKHTEERGLADLQGLGAFDTVLILRNNFGLAGSAAKGRATLRRLCSVTTEDARLITDSVDPSRDPNPVMHEDAAKSLRFRVRYRDLATPWFRYLMLTPEELETQVAGTGWHVARVIADESPRYVAVVERDRG